MSKLTNKVALVTGGSRGIGAAIAKRLAADGASVAFTYAKDASAASAVVKAIELVGGKAVAIQADAADAEAVKGAVEKAVATFGRLDVLVNNAGTAIPKSFEETTLEEMDRVIDINIRGVFATTQAALKHMKEGGRIIMVGSAVGERAVAPGLVPYAATKGAVKMFTQALSREVGSRGITVIGLFLEGLSEDAIGGSLCVRSGMDDEAVILFQFGNPVLDVGGGVAVGVFVGNASDSAEEGRAHLGD
jgi:3-oxoacyl-[acyl-carrier protein] reductase